MGLPLAETAELLTPVGWKLASEQNVRIKPQDKTR
jgi:hypothetical protein